MTSQPTDEAPPTALSEVGSVDGVPLGIPLTRNQLVTTRRKLEEFKKAVGRQSHCIIVIGGLGFLDSERKGSTEREVLDCCRHRFGYPTKRATFGRPSKRVRSGYPAKRATDPLHVIVDSNGGSLDSAFRTMLFLRSFAEDIRVYVPRRAKSAATLLALGADEVIMSPFAELGPLDTQIRDPRNPTKNISTLDCYQSVDYVQKFGLDTLPKALTVLLRETDARIPLSEIVDFSTDFALREVTQMLGGINVLDFGGWGRTLKIGETYARVLQQRRRRPDRREKIDEIANRLVYYYTHHPYVIDFEEARKVGFNVSLMTDRVYEAAFPIAEACDEGRLVGGLDDIQKRIQESPVDVTRPSQWFFREDQAVAAVISEPHTRSSAYRGS